MAQYELNIRDYWRVIRKRKNIVIFTAFLLTLLTFAISLVQRPKPVYEAIASVKVEKATSIAGLFLEMVTISSGDTLATQTVIIRSFPVLERVAKSLGEIPENIPPEVIRVDPQYSRIISQLQSSITTEQEGMTNIINIRVTSTDPDYAQKVANTVAEKFKEYSVLERNRQIIEGRKFIERQLKLVEGRLKKAEDALKRFREVKGVVSLSEEQSNLLKRYADLEARRDEIDKERKEIKAELESIKRKKRPGKRFNRFATGKEPPLMLRLSNKLSDLLLQRENLLINYLPAHPKVQDLNKKISNVIEEIKRVLNSRLDALARERYIIEDGLKALRGKVALLPATALKLSRLEREIEINEKLFSLLKSKYQEALIRESEKIEEVTIIRHALRPDLPINPSRTFANTLIALLIGLVFGLLAAFVWESLDTSIGAIEDVEAFLELPVLGVIPYIESSRTREKLKKLYPGLDDETYGIYSTMISHFLPKSIPAESFRALRTNVQFLQKDRGVKTIVITSSSIGEGKTTATINLAITIAQMGRRVLIVDGDLRNHSIHHFFGLDREPGLADAILGNIKWEEATKNITDIMLGSLRVEDLLSTSGLDNISVLTAGRTLTNPSEFLNSSIVEDIIKEMKMYYDYVLFDSPSALPVADAVIISGKVDGVLMVYQVGRIARSALKRTKLVLDNVNARILGVVLNGLKEEVSPDFYQMNYYYYNKDRKKVMNSLRRRFFQRKEGR